MGNTINQTNRTMLMEMLNPQKMDFLTLVGDVRGMESLSDDKIKEIHEHLLVRSFDEALEKFEPAVYCYYNANNQKVMYSLEKPETIPEEMLTEIPLNRKNEFLNMLMSMIDTKRAEGVINVDFKFEKLTDMISPKKVMDDIKQNRKELQYTYSEYAKLEDGDPHKKDLADKLNVMFEEASANYNNVMAMLPLAIEDIKTRLLLGDGTEKKDNTPLALGVLSMGNDGELRVLEAPKVETTALATVDDNINAGLIAALKEDYQALNEESNDYTEALVARTFCPLVSTMESGIDKEKEVANYNSYLAFYKESKDEFIRTVKPLIEKLLGIWCFFEQYPKKMKGMRPSMLITNQSNEMMAKSGNISRLITYLTTVNAKNDFGNTVWYAIVPSVSLDQYSKMKLTRERFKGNTAAVKTDVNSVESLARLLDVFKDYEVQCFFSYETGDATTFNRLATEGMEWKVELVKMTGNTVLAEAVNHFHEILFENSVKEMKQLAQEGSGLFYMGEHVDFRHYSRNIHTIKCFYWGKVFTVVDVKNTHMPMIGGVSIISANFNVETGKKYELADLYEKDNYFEWILSEIEKRYPKQEYLVKNWKACFERNNFTFLMAEHGLVLVDNFSQNVELMEWECMENILNQEIKSIICEDDEGLWSELWNIG